MAACVGMMSALSACGSSNACSGSFCSEDGAAGDSTVGPDGDFGDSGFNFGDTGNERQRRVRRRVLG